MTDIVERLRQWFYAKDVEEAVDEIERLRAELGDYHRIAREASKEIERLMQEVEHLNDVCERNWTGEDIVACRSDALEEAAKWLEECEGQEIADAIRALKEKP
jgi:archaellum component FlaC